MGHPATLLPYYNLTESQGIWDNYHQIGAVILLKGFSNKMQVEIHTVFYYLDPNKTVQCNCLVWVWFFQES